MEGIVVFITTGSTEEADRVSAALLEARLVACVNRISGVDSRYWWLGNLDRADEILLIAKTRRELWPEILAAVRENHSYEVFEAIALPVIESNPDYLTWIVESTRSSAGDHS